MNKVTISTLLSGGAVMAVFGPEGGSPRTFKNNQTWNAWYAGTSMVQNHAAAWRDESRTIPATKHTSSMTNHKTVALCDEDLVQKLVAEIFNQGPGFFMGKEPDIELA
jgi:hypothetical protein